MQSDNSFHNLISVGKEILSVLHNGVRNQNPRKKLFIVQLKKKDQPESPYCSCVKSPKELTMEPLIFSEVKKISDYLIEQANLYGQPVDKDSEDHKNIVKSIFDHEDRDKDGIIWHDEFSGPKHDEL